MLILKRALDMLLELSRREKISGTKPDEDLDIFMKVHAYCSVSMLHSFSFSIDKEINVGLISFLVTKVYPFLALVLLFHSLPDLVLKLHFYSHIWSHR